MSMFLIRPATREDFETWFSYREALWLVPDEQDERREMEEVFASSEKAVFFAEKEGVGPVAYIETSIRNYAEGCITDRVAYAEGWYVDPDWRGQGVGKMLMGHAEQWGRDQGCTEMASDVEISNELSITVHKKLGFRETDRIVTFAKKLK